MTNHEVFESLKSVSRNKRKKILKILRSKLNPSCTWALYEKKNQDEKIIKQKIKDKELRKFNFTREDWQIIKQEGLNPKDYVHTKKGLVKKENCIHYQQITTKKHINRVASKILYTDDLKIIDKRKKTMPNINRKAPPLLINDKPIDIKIKKQLKNKFDRNFEDKNKSFKLE